MRALGNIEVGSAKATYVLVKIVGTSATYRWSLGSPIMVTAGPVFYDGGRIPNEDAVDGLSYEVSLGLGGAVQRSGFGSLKIINVDGYAESIKADIRGGAITISLAQAQVIADEVAPYVLELMKGIVVDVKYDREFAVIRWMPSRMVDRFVLVPKHKMTSDLFTQILDSSRDVAIPLLLGDWRTGADIVDVDLENDNWMKWRNFCAGVELNLKTALTYDLLYVVGDHPGAGLDYSAVVYVDTLQRYAHVSTGVAASSASGLETGRCYVSHLDALTLKTVVKPDAEYASEAGELGWKNVATSPELAWDNDVTTSAYMTKLTTATYEDGSGGYPAGWYRAFSGIFEAKRKAHTRINAENSTLKVKLKYSLVNISAPDSELVTPYLKRIVDSGPDDLIATGTTRTASGNYTEVFSVPAPYVDTFLNDPDTFYVSVRWRTPNEAPTNPDSEVYIYETGVVWTFEFGQWVWIEKKQVPALYTPPAPLTPIAALDPIRVVAPFREIPAAVGAVPLVKYLIGVDSPAEIGSIVAYCINGRQFGAWIDVDRDNGYDEDDVITNHAYAVEELLRTDFTFGADIDVASFDAVGNTVDGTRKDWEIRFQAHQAIDGEDILDIVCADSATALTFGNDEVAKLLTLQYDADPAVKIYEKDITRDSKVSVAEVNPELKATEIWLRYGLNYVTNRYENLIVLNGTTFWRYGIEPSVLSYVRSGDPISYITLAANAKTAYVIDKKVELLARTVRDHTTATRLVRFYADWLMQDRRVVSVEGAALSLIALEVGDIVKLELDLVTGVFVIQRWEYDVSADITQVKFLELKPQGWS